MPTRVPRKVGDLLDGPTTTPNSGDALTWDGSRYQPSPAGAGNDLHYTHAQAVAAATWTITHNLGKKPSVSCFEDFGSGGATEIEGQVFHVSTNQLTVSFNAAVSGFAHLN